MVSTQQHVAMEGVQNTPGPARHAGKGYDSKGEVDDTNDGVGESRVGETDGCVGRGDDGADGDDCLNNGAAGKGDGEGGVVVGANAD